MSRPVSPYNPVTPTPEETAAVRTALQRLTSDEGLDIVGRDSGKAGELPELATSLIRRLLQDLAAGRAVTIIPLDADVSTFQAAEILNVSRPYVIKLLDAAAIPFHMVGTHRRIRLDDLLAYKERQDRIADAAMDELVAEAQELKLGY